MLLRLENISKTFPGVKALTEVSMSLETGEVHALCGENGAGKSTLMNILVGNHQPDEGGRIYIDEEEIQIADFNHARRLGIGIVYQERSLIDSLSIAENIFANRYPLNRWGLIDHKELERQTRHWLHELEMPTLSPQQIVATLSPAEKQMVEIAKTLSQNPRLLILDEPTASLTEKEMRVLFSLIRKLKNEGTAIVYISHRMAEIFEIAQKVSVLKDGHYQGTLDIADTTPQQLIRLMVGREIAQLNSDTSATAEKVLEVTNLCGAKFKNISFSVHKGEIVALAGLMGAGRSEIARAIFGIDPKNNGSVLVNGQECTILHPADAMKYGIGYVPEDRKHQGLFLEMSVKENIIAATLSSANFVAENEQLQIADRFKTDLNIQTPHLKQPVRLLSGGNQQKCVLARWLHLKPDLLMVDEPTHGVDVGAKFDIYQLLKKQAADGKGILLISSELPEVLALADRILVLYHGHIVGELDREEATEEKILALASGHKFD
ncbi:MAG: sugar ABC transporter ATP-binding protein [Runella sp.]